MDGGYVRLATPGQSGQGVTFTLVPSSLDRCDDRDQDDCTMRAPPSLMMLGVHTASDPSVTDGAGRIFLYKAILLR